MFQIILPVIFAISVMLTYSIYKLCCTFGILDIPNQRSTHSTPKALMGGGAIFLTFDIAIISYYYLKNSFHIDIITPTSILIILSICATLIALAGLLDDIFKFSPLQKITIHLIAAVASVIAFFPVINAPHNLISTLLLVAGIIWIVGNINIYNFMDGIDGIAGGCGIIFACFFALTGYLQDMPIVFICSLLLIPCIAGFLFWNLPPARIFMGDAGSTFLGYFFALMALLLCMKSIDNILVGAIILLPFLYDGAYTIVRRAMCGAKIWQAHREHLYQRLVQSGWSHRKTSFLYYILAILCGVASQLPGGLYTNMAVILIYAIAYDRFNKKLVN